MKKIIHTDLAPAAIGPYSQAVAAGNTLYISGQIAIDPSTGALNMPDISTETHQVMNNMGAILKAAQADHSNVVKCTILLSSMDHYATVNGVYAAYFKNDPPAREAFAVKGLPKGVNVEISAIAVL